MFANHAINMSPSENMSFNHNIDIDTVNNKEIETVFEEEQIITDGAKELDNRGDVNQNRSTEVLKVISFGINCILVASHYIGNGIILSSFGEDEQAAASLISNIQAVTTGTIFGTLLATGVKAGPIIGEVDKLLKENKNKEAEDKLKEVGTIIKISWIVGGSMSMLSAAGYLSMPLYLPHIIKPSTAKATSDFFLTFSLGAFSDPVSTSNVIVIGLIEKSIVNPLVLTAIYRLPALGFGYLFAKYFDMGPRGLGLGTAVASLSSYFATQIWLSRSVYKKYGLYECYFPQFKRHLISFFGYGWKTALQRLSEWINLTAISILIGSWSNDSLRVLEPAMHANFLVALSLQGMGSAAMVFIGRDTAAQKLHYERFKKNLSKAELREYFKLKNINRNAFYKNNLTGFILSAGLSGGIYLAKQPICRLFLGSNITLHEEALAESILLWNLIGLLPDALRILSGGILRGWGDLLLPTIVSILLMTVVAVPAGGAISYYADDKSPLPLIWARDIAMILSAIINFFRFFQHTRSDNLLYNNGKLAIDIYEKIEKWLSLDLDTNNNPNFVNLEKIGFKIDRQFNNIYELLSYELISICEDNSYSEQELKYISSLYISENLNKYMKKYNCSEDEFLSQIGLDDDMTFGVIIHSLSKKLNINIININAIDMRPELACQLGKDRDSIYVVRCGNNLLYSLSGEPKREFINKIYYNSRSDKLGILGLFNKTIKQNPNTISESSGLLDNNIKKYLS